MYTARLESGEQLDAETIVSAIVSGTPSADPFRFPDTHPVTWARGKTPEEVLQVARGYEEAFNAGRAPQAQVPQPAAPPPPHVPRARP